MLWSHDSGNKEELILFVVEKSWIKDDGNGKDVWNYVGFVSIKYS